MALPVIDSLAEQFPAARLDVLVGNHSAPVFQDHTHVNRILLMPSVPGWRDVVSLVSRLRAGRYDWIVLLDRSRLLRRVVRTVAPSGALLILDPAPGSDFRHESDIYLDALREAGLPAAVTMPRIAFSNDALSRASDIANDIGGPFAIVHPGGAMNPGSVLPQKRWPLERYTALIRSLQEEGLDCLITGGTDERELCRDVATTAGLDESRCFAGDLSLVESAALISRANLYVGNDTGISHLAAATGTPTVVIFGPTNPLRYGPRGETVRILAPEASYRIHDTDLRKSTPGAAHISTEEITVEQVRDACRSIVSELAWSENWAN